MSRKEKMRQYWANLTPEQREARLAKMKEAGLRRRKKDLKDLPDQREDPKTYSREFQRAYRKRHPEYYRNLQRKRRQEKKENA